MLNLFFFLGDTPSLSHKTNKEFTKLAFPTKICLIKGERSKRKSVAVKIVSMKYIVESDKDGYRLISEMHR